MVHIFYLVGESSGKGPRGLATKVQGTGGLQTLNAQVQASTSSGSEIGRAKMVSTRFVSLVLIELIVFIIMFKVYNGILFLKLILMKRQFQ